MPSSIENFLNTTQNKKLTESELRNNYNLYIVINPEFYQTGIDFYYQIFHYVPNDKHGDYLDEYTYGIEYHTYEQALNEALIKANEIVKLINQNK